MKVVELDEIGLGLDRGLKGVEGVFGRDAGIAAVGDDEGPRRADEFLGGGGIGGAGLRGVGHGKNRRQAMKKKYPRMARMARIRQKDVHFVSLP